MGIQSFLFGQVFYQDNSDITVSWMPEMMRHMREHAQYLGFKIIIGAQTNDIEDESYLRLFDYIEGGSRLTKRWKRGKWRVFLALVETTRGLVLGAFVAFAFCRKGK
jgi:hypothetical protein